jgi:hypothetical protein
MRRDMVQEAGGIINGKMGLVLMVRIGGISSFEYH